jgi:hypothetical protein
MHHYDLLMKKIMRSEASTNTHCYILLATVVLPEPDAPATTSTLPRSRMKLTSSTALTTRSGCFPSPPLPPDLKSWRKLFLIGKYFMRFLVSSSTSNYSSKLSCWRYKNKRLQSLVIYIHTYKHIIHRRDSL